MKYFDNMTDAVIAAKKGDSDGFAYIYEQTYGEKYYIALKYMKNTVDADDVISEAYIKAWEKIDTLTDAEKIGSWLGQIVARTALDVLKKKKPKLFSSIEDDAEAQSVLDVENPSIDEHPEKSYTSKERQQLIQQMIDSLSDEQRICVLMYYYEEMAVTQIAEMLECPEGTVMSRLNYARKNLKKKADELQQKGYNIRYNI